MKKIIILISLSFAFCFSTLAQDVIMFRWNCNSISGYEKSFRIDATEGEKFIVNWDNGYVDTLTGVSGYLISRHTYHTSNNAYNVTIKAITDECHFHRFDCSNQAIGALNVSECTALIDLDCSNNYFNLDWGGLILNTALKVLNCSNSRLFGSIDMILNNCVELITLNCSDNSLFGLDLSTNAKLQQLYCNNCDLGELNISNCRELIELQCNDNHLAGLNLDSNSILERIECYGNRFQLSDLYNISEIISDGNNKLLGTQFLKEVTYTANIGDTLFIEQAEFNGIFTNYLVAFPNSNYPPYHPVIFETHNLVPLSCYTTINGAIIFHKAGDYAIKLTNETIVSHHNYPAEMIVYIKVISDVGINENITSNIQVFPNPAKDILDINTPKNTEIKSISIYSINGKLIEKNMYSFNSGRLNIDNLEKGSYVINIETYKGNINKLIIKK